MKNNNTVLPIFFAIDDNYAPFLCVALRSILDNASEDTQFRIYILSTSLSKKNTDNIISFASDKVKIEFVNVSNAIEKIEGKFVLRDYYSKATYYRFFISELFPQYDKALYLDCDIIVTTDITRLFNISLGDNLIGAIQEEVMDQVEVFGKYAETVVGVPCREYFNAGILVMNLKEFRARKIESRFIDLLSKRKFAVTQDQDYLNVIAHGSVKYIDLAWNKTPIKNRKFGNRKPKLIHYKINWKPWHYDNVLYEEYFWKYAKKTELYDELIDMKDNYSSEEKLRDAEAYKNLMALAAQETKAVLETQKDEGEKEYVVEDALLSGGSMI